MTEHNAIVVIKFTNFRDFAAIVRHLRFATWEDGHFVANRSANQTGGSLAKRSP